MRGREPSANCPFRRIPLGLLSFPAVSPRPTPLPRTPNRPTSKKPNARAPRSRAGSTSARSSPTPPRSRWTRPRSSSSGMRGSPKAGRNRNSEYCQPARVTTGPVTDDRYRPAPMPEMTMNAGRIRPRRRASRVDHASRSPGQTRTWPLAPAMIARRPGQPPRQIKRASGPGGSLSPHVDAMLSDTPPRPGACPRLSGQRALSAPHAPSSESVCTSARR